MNANKHLSQAGFFLLEMRVNAWGHAHIYIQKDMPEIGSVHEDVCLLYANDDEYNSSLTCRRSCLLCVVHYLNIHLNVFI